MAEILVKAVDAPDVGKDPGAYATGDVVYVGEDGHGWGTDELNKTIFAIISVPDADAQTVRALINSAYLSADRTRLLSVSRWKWSFLGKKFIDKSTGAVAFAGALLKE